MLRVMSDAEVSAIRERVTFLYQSKWLEDNLTAVLMDTSRGNSGMDEATARVKVHGILDWMELRKQQDEARKPARTPSKKER